MDQVGLRGRVAGSAAAAVALLAAIGVALSAAPARGESVGFLYVEPGAGSAGGGHFGVQLGDEVYHFQSADHWLRLARWNAGFFRYAYGVRENRSIQVARVDVDAETLGALERRFARRYGVERKHAAVIGSLARDRLLIERLRDPPEPGIPGVLPFRLPGAGLFEPGDPEPVLVRLRERISRSHGAAHLSARSEALRAEILALRPEVTPPGASVSADELPVVGYRFSERYSDLTLELLAVEALRDAWRLHPRMLRRLSGPGATLSGAERRSLEQLAADIEARLVDLLRSRRPDRGFPLLLFMARRIAIDASLASGRLVVLDAFPADAAAADSASVTRRRVFFEELRAEAARELGRARSRLASGAPVDEPAYQALEEAANRFLELDLALAGGALRLSGERLVPEGPAREAAWLLPPARGVDLATLLAAAREAEVDYRRQATRVYAYDMWRHNCVTEIFRTIDAALPPGESQQRLGGRVDPDGFLHFVPAVAFAAVVDRYRVRETAEIPSFRRAKLAEMYAREGRVRTYLRESNTLSSSLYRGDDADSAFLFFTEDAVWPRPVQGAFNLAAGLGQLSWGIVTAPFDAGAALEAGVEGVLFSLPELVFVSLRKGSMAYAWSEGSSPGERVLETR